jgi:hypothetical protein
MKKLISICSTIATMQCCAQEALYNNGGELHINGQAVLQVNGNFVTRQGSYFNNMGELHLAGNFINHQSMAINGAGTLLFEGTMSQTLAGTAQINARQVVFNNAQGIQLANTLQVDGDCHFIKGIVHSPTQQYPLLLGSGSTIVTPATDSSHVNGYLIKLGTGSFTYPLGDGLRYQPIQTNLVKNTEGMLASYVPADAGVAPFANTGTETNALVSYNPNEYWILTPMPDGKATGEVTLYWDGYNDAFNNPLAQRRVAHRYSGNWLNEGNTAIGDTLAGSVTSNGINYWQHFALGTIQYVLPLQLVSFTGSSQPGYNLLKWTTSNELNTHHFVLEYSTDGRNFSTAGTLQWYSVLPLTYGR